MVFIGKVWRGEEELLTSGEESVFGEDGDGVDD
jgi:hypothetical protein